MKKNVGLTYVSDFSFPKEQGFTGSAGVQHVKGYRRGGHVKGKGRNTPNKAAKRAKGTTKAAAGGFMGPEREITVDDVTITTPRRFGEGGYYGKPGDKYPKSKAKQKMPKNVKARGGSVHDKLKREGKKMGYAYGGQVKDTSADFKAKRGKMKSMDDGVQPARRGASARNQQEREAGGTGRLKPGLKKGGKVYAVGGVVRGALKGAKYVRRAGKRSPDKTRGRGMSKKGMPKTVKAKGGLAKYAEGGYAAGDKKSHPTGRGRKPYTGYNKQPGGSGNEDARYMGKAGAAR